MTLIDCFFFFFFLHSLSEPSLFTPHDSILFGLSSVHRPNLLQKRGPASSSFLKPAALTSGSAQPFQDTHQPQSYSRPVYIHFSQAIQPSLKPKVTRRHSHNPGLSSDAGHSDLRPLGTQDHEPLSVVGKTCLPSCGLRPAPAASSGPTRPQLHVFLPTEAEGEDSESVDEGFMDELDSKMSSLKLQQGAPQTAPLYCCRKKLSPCPQ